MKSGSLWIVGLAEVISNRVHASVSTWPGAEKRHLGDQLIRSTDSIAANIVEGYARHHVNDKLRFYSIARGSLEESFSWVRKAKSRGLLGVVEANQLLGLLQRLAAGLIAFTRRRVQE